MTHEHAPDPAAESIPLSAIVAGQALLQNGILPDASPERVEATTSSHTIVEIVKSTFEQTHALDVSADRQGRVLQNALERVERQTGGIINADELILKAGRIRQKRDRKRLINGDGSSLSREARRARIITRAAGVNYKSELLEPKDH